QPVVEVLRLRQLIAQARFADAWLSDDAYYLPMALCERWEEIVQVYQLPLPTHEATQGALPVRLQRGATWPHPHDGIGADAVSDAYARWPLASMQFEPSIDQPTDLR